MQPQIKSPQRVKREAKKLAAIEAVRDEASVMLDALLLGRKDLEVDIPRFRELAIWKLQLAYNAPGHYKRLVRWVNLSDGHKIYCSLCGTLIVTIPNGYWSRLEVDERHFLLDRHTTLCALQVLAGIRQLAPSAAQFEPENEELLRIPYQGPPDLVATCVECGAFPGMPCFNFRKDEKAWRLVKPHKARSNGPNSSTTPGQL